MGSWGLSYRSDREVRHWMMRDPIALHRQTLIDWSVLTPQAADKIEEDAKQLVVDAFKWADNSPDPRAEDALAKVFSQGPAIMPRQLASCPLYDGYKQVV
jgi:pyruvate dehydrogenase E1 component alpha subunit